LTLGLVVGAVMTAYKLMQSRRGPATEPMRESPSFEPAAPPPAAPAPAPPPATAPAPATSLAQPPKPKSPPKPKKPAPAIDPVDGTCPDSHPVKGKLTSGIFHVPGGFNYPRTKADRCYVDAAAAEAEGLRPSKR
jgi:hypothetical protein